MYVHTFVLFYFSDCRVLYYFCIVIFFFYFCCVFFFCFFFFFFFSSRRRHTRYWRDWSSDVCSSDLTLARLFLGLITPSTGEVLYNGTDLRKLQRDERRSFLRDVQMIFQDPYEVYNPFYKVDHVLETPISEFKLASGAQARRALIHESLRAVGLRPDETLGRYPHQLSGGQRQRIMVARAVLLRPRLISADEPVSMADASLRATILESLRQLNRDYGMSIVS